MSNSMEMLIICRFIQGLGGGALMPVAMATVADLYAPTERGKIQGMLGAVFAIATIIGPLMGGYIVDNMDWRWVFYVNLPVGVFAILVASMKFPKLVSDNRKPIDYPGMVTLIGTLAPALLVITWGGNTYAWASAEIVGLIALSVVSLVAFLMIEKRASDPILPLYIFKEPIVSLASAGLFIMSLGMFGVISFLPLFLQAVIGMSASNSGELIIPLMGGVMITMLLSGFLLKRTGYKIWLLIGPPLAALGLFMLSTLHSGSSQWDAILYLVITGAGLGAVMANFIVAAQNVVCKKDMGVVTSSISLFRSIGGTVGVAALGGLINAKMVEELGRNLAPGVLQTLPTTDANSVGQLLLMTTVPPIPAPILDAIRLSLSNSITYAFFVGAIIVLVSLVASVLVRRVPLKSVEEYHELEVKADGPKAGVVEQSVLEATKAIDGKGK
jgi:EmrB/QacA subfamily drug resistance transporter